MITLEKIGIYKKFGGDIDGWSRFASFHQKQIMENEDWSMIDSFRQDIFLMKRGLVSGKFQEEAKKKLKDGCDSDVTIAELQKLAQ